MFKNLLPIIISGSVVLLFLVGSIFTYQSVFAPQIKTETQKTTQQTISTTAQNSTQANANSCIITISGKKYDVAELKNSHSGGDVFKCGTDMTNVYKDQHGSVVGRIQKYLVN